MKKLICLIVAVVAGMAAFAQTPKEILARMDAETTAREAEGYSMQIDIKMPILGTMPSKAWTLGDKTRLEATMMGVTVITWSDGVTSWTYTEKTNEIEIKPDDPSDNDSDLSVIDDLDGYDIYGYPDCGLYPDDAARRLVARKIREYEPDFVVTHRTCDYHADHRATGQLVMDAGYLLGVPHWCEEAKAQRLRPVIFYMSDPFTYPRELRPDVMVDADPYLDKWCEGLDAQVSQFYEWLPWDRGREEDVVALGDRSDIAKRNAFLVRWTAGRKRADARRYADEWRSQHPGAQVPKHIEVYEVSEYGRAPTESDLRLFLGE